MADRSIQNPIAGGGVERQCAALEVARTCKPDYPRGFFSDDRLERAKLPAEIECPILHRHGTGSAPVASKGQLPAIKNLGDAGVDVGVRLHQNRSACGVRRDFALIDQRA